MEKQVGQTKDVGFQFGIRRTFTIPSDQMWDFLFSQRGLNIWLGELATEFELKKEFATHGGIKGFVRVFNPNSHIRINWQKPNWTNLSTVQLRVIKKNESTTISFHHEKLIDAEQREEVKKHWTGVLENIATELEKQANL